MAKVQKVIVAGTGSIGQRHITNLLELRPDCSFILLRKDGREDAFSAELGASVESSFAVAMTHDPDALIVATPSAFHIEILLPAIAAGLPMYAEKPVVTETRDIAQLRQAMDEHNYTATTLVGCNLRFLPSLNKMRQLVKTGCIGRVVRGCFEAGQWLPDWRPGQDHRQSYSADPQRGGGVILDLIHELDAARWLLGEMNTVQALTAQVPALGITSEAVAGVLMRSEDGAVVNLGLDYVARRLLRRYQLVGEEGTLTWDLPAATLTLDKMTGSEVIDCGEAGFDVAATYKMAMAEFLSAVETGMPTSQSLEEGLRSTELALRIKEQACLNHSA